MAYPPHFPPIFSLHRHTPPNHPYTMATYAQFINLFSPPSVNGPTPNTTRKRAPAATEEQFAPDCSQKRGSWRDADPKDSGTRKRCAPAEEQPTSDHPGKRVRWSVDGVYILHDEHTSEGHLKLILSKKGCIVKDEYTPTQKRNLQVLHDDPHVGFILWKLEATPKRAVHCNACNEKITLTRPDKGMFDLEHWYGHYRRAHGAIHPEEIAHKGLDACHLLPKKHHLCWAPCNDCKNKRSRRRVARKARQMASRSAFPVNPPQPVVAVASTSRLTEPSTSHQARSNRVGTPNVSSPAAEPDPPQAASKQQELDVNQAAELLLAFQSTEHVFAVPDASSSVGSRSLQEEENAAVEALLALTDSSPHSSAAGMPPSPDQK